MFKKLKTIRLSPIEPAAVEVKESTRGVLKKELLL